MSFATPEDLGVFLGRTDLDAPQAQMILDGATAAIRAEANQTITRATSTDLLMGTWSLDLELPERPVVSIGSVKLNGVVMAAADYEWEGLQVLRRGQLLGRIGVFDGNPRRPGAYLGSVGHWGGPASTVEVTYTHGYATVPADLMMLCLQIAARVLINPQGLQSESLGAYSVRYVNHGSGGPTVLLDEDEKRVARRYQP